jgi:hypothetical protein
VLDLPFSELSSSSPIAGALQLWATSLALAYLEIVLSTFRSDWELATNKSKSYLLNELMRLQSPAKVEEMIEQAKKVLQLKGVKVQ